MSFDMTLPSHKQPKGRRRPDRLVWIVITCVSVVSGSSVLLWSTKAVVVTSKWLVSSSSETVQAKTEHLRRNKSTSSINRIPVYLWPNVNKSNFDDETLGYATYSFEYKHFVLEGIDQSSSLQRIYNASSYDEHPSLIWMTDLFQGKRPSRWCAALTSAVRQAQEQAGNNIPPPTWPLYIMDWNDDPKLPWRYQHCDELYDLLGRKNVYYVKRSMVVDRHWDESLNSIRQGVVDPAFANNYSDWSAAPIQHLSYGIRTDLLETMQQIIQDDYADCLQNPTNSTIEDWDLASLLPRPLDVAHFWPAPEQQTATKEVNRGGNADKNNSQLRDAVSRAVYQWNLTISNATGFAGLTGRAMEQGRVEPQKEYAHALLQYKIVVVAQKDEWEGHYRLMEALSGGALVFTDRMLLPPEGFEDGKSLVVYDNVTDMVSKIEFYLWHASKATRESIAREGRRLAMTQHRSWHIMERIVHGKSGIS